MTTLSLIIPSYNEVENLMILEKKLAKVFANKNDIEIIIVDNGSQDDTPKVLEKIIKKTTLKTLRSIKWIKIKDMVLVFWQAATLQKEI